MRSSRTDGDSEGRLDRLASDGRRGGGIPLPLLFAAILEELLDEGAITAERAVAITSAKLDFKQQQVLSTWASWEDLADDVLMQMKQQRIVTPKGSAWLAGPRLIAGKRLVIIPERPGKSGATLGVTVYERAERDRRAQLAEIQMTVTELASKLLPDAAGIRPVDQGQVERIRESIADTGHLYPVLIDKQGHILDGKHRLAADPDWPRKEIRPARDDLSALAVARLANMGQPLPPKVASTIDRLLGDTRVAQQAQNERIRRALAEYPDDSHNAIAKRLGVNHVIVDRACAEVVQSTTSTCRHGLTGQGAGGGPKPKADRRRGAQARRVVTPEIEEQITDRVAEGASIKEIASEFEIGEMPARDAQQRAIGRLEVLESINGQMPSAVCLMSSKTEAPTTAKDPPDAVAVLRTVVETVQLLLGKWTDAPPDPSTELAAWLDLRRTLDERVAALSDQRP